jgi:hypothetical protein
MAEKDDMEKDGGFVGWWSQPFSPDMSALEWFAWIGLLLAALALWGLIIKRISETDV